MQNPVGRNDSEARLRDSVGKEIAQAERTLVASDGIEPIRDPRILVGDHRAEDAVRVEFRLG